MLAKTYAPLPSLFADTVEGCVLTAPPETGEPAARRYPVMVPAGVGTGSSLLGASPQLQRLRARAEIRVRDLDPRSDRVTDPNAAPGRESQYILPPTATAEYKPADPGLSKWRAQR